MGDEDLALLAERAFQGCASSEEQQKRHEQLLEALRPMVARCLRKLLRQPADIDDALSQTLLRALEEITAGRYTHHNLAALRSWIETIARRIALEILKKGKREQPFGPTITDEGIEIVLDVPDPTENTAELAQNRYLANFLDRQLQEVLIDRHVGARERAEGHLRKLAFYLFYVDQQSQREIVSTLASYALVLGIPEAVTQTMVNNWLSRGDILKALAAHLVEAHRDLVDLLADPDAYADVLTDDEYELLRRSWREGESIEELARHPVRKREEVEKTLRSARRKVSGALANRLKAQLHEIRHRR